MARAMWWALALVTLASGARYGDYTEVKMPEYGSAIDYDGPRDSPPAPGPEVDDYHEHSPDAPAPMEYKYEEDRGKSDKRMKGVADSDEWQSSVKKHKKYLENVNQENFDAYGPEESNSNHRHSKYQPRLKPRHPHDEDLSAEHNKHSIRYGVSRKKDISNLESKENMDGTVDDFEDDKAIDFDEDQINIQKNHRMTTVRTARRKPRDRFIKSELTSDEEDPIMNIRRQPVKDEFRPEDVAHTRTLIRRPQYRQGAGARAKTGGGQRGGYLPKKYDDYVEYYDMKRVQGVKEKLMKEKIEELPRPTIRPFPMRPRPRTRARLQEDDDDNSDENGLEGLRRLMNPMPSLAAYGHDKEQDEDEPQQRLKMVPITNADDSKTGDKTTTTTSTTRAPRVAERELTALLSPHRERRVIDNPIVANYPAPAARAQPPVYIPHAPHAPHPHDDKILVSAALSSEAVDPLHEDEWSNFITTNNSKRLQLSKLAPQATNTR